MSLLIVGCGYLGQRVGARLVRRGLAVYGTVRSAARAGEIAGMGIRPVIADVTRPDSLAALPAATRLLYCVGFDRTGGADRRSVHVDGLRAVLCRLPTTDLRLVYASSTSVYGQSQGEWVDEDSPTVPLQEPGKICLEAEETLGRWARERRWSAVVLRFSGLYGPGRVLRRRELQRGEPIPGDPSRLLNLVHIDDAAQAAEAAIEAERPDPLFIVSDDRPVERREYFELAARGLGAPPVRFGGHDGRRANGTADAPNRRLCNRRLRERLGVRLVYPDITAGIPAALGTAGSD